MISTVMMILLASISEHSFLVRAFQVLYLAKTNNTNIFRKVKRKTARSKLYEFKTLKHDFKP